MASKPSGAWKKPLPHATKKSDTGFPGLDPSSPKAKPPKFDYEELQRNELIALESILGEDFIKTEQRQTAWQVSHA